MDFIKESEFDSCLKVEGKKLFYKNENEAGKEYEHHMQVLNGLCEDFRELKIYVIKNENKEKETHKKSYEFLFYDNNDLIKSFKNSYIGEITSFIRKKMLAMENESNTSNRINGIAGVTAFTNEQEPAKSEVVKRIEKLLNGHSILLFMKGTKDMPKCKFSNAVVEMLDKSKVKYDTYDILEDEELRSELKNYSQWPTYPQLYVNKELVGGHDIIKELFDTNQLNTIIPSAYFF